MPALRAGFIRVLLFFVQEPPLWHDAASAFPSRFPLRRGRATREVVPLFCPHKATETNPLRYYADSDRRESAPERGRVQLAQSAQTHLRCVCASYGHQDPAQGILSADSPPTMRAGNSRNPFCFHTVCYAGSERQNAAHGSPNSLSGARANPRAARAGSTRKISPNAS